MQDITSTAELKNAIELLEAEHIVKGQLLKEQFILTYESLKPINVLKRTLKEITSPSNLTDDIPGTLMGIASGYLSKKVFTGRSGNIFRKLLGSILQIGITNIVTKNSDVIRSAVMGIIQHFLNKKEMNSRSRVS